jgi:hypothetical protein
LSSPAGRRCAESEAADLVLVAASRNVDDTLFGDTPSKLINNPHRAQTECRSSMQLPSRDACPLPYASAFELRFIP